jgi:hypothetical protein
LEPFHRGLAVVVGNEVEHRDRRAVQCGGGSIGAELHNYTSACPEVSCASVTR